MSSPDFTQAAARLWMNVGEPEGFTRTAFLRYLRSPEGGSLHIRTQSYFRIIDEITSEAAYYQAEWNKPLNLAPTDEDILTMSGANFNGYLQHVHVATYVPTSEGEYTLIPIRYSVKTSELISREDALATAVSDVSRNRGKYDQPGTIVAGGFYIGTWRAGE